MKKIIKQVKKAENACRKANAECQVLASVIAPYIHADLRDSINVFDQPGDGLVMEWESYNYPITEIMEVIKQGKRDIDMRTWNCPITAI